MRAAAPGGRAAGARPGGGPARRTLLVCPARHDCTCRTSTDGPGRPNSPTSCRLARLVENAFAFAIGAGSSARWPGRTCCGEEATVGPPTARRDRARSYAAVKPGRPPLGIALTFRQLRHHRRHRRPPRSGHGLAPPASQQGRVSGGGPRRARACLACPRCRPCFELGERLTLTEGTWVMARPPPSAGDLPCFPPSSALLKSQPCWRPRSRSTPTWHPAGAAALPRSAGLRPRSWLHTPASASAKTEVCAWLQWPPTSTCFKQVIGESVGRARYATAASAAALRMRAPHLDRAGRAVLTRSSIAAAGRPAPSAMPAPRQHRRRALVHYAPLRGTTPTPTLRAAALPSWLPPAARGRRHSRTLHRQSLRTSATPRTTTGFSHQHETILNEGVRDRSGAACATRCPARRRRAVPPDDGCRRAAINRFRPARGRRRLRVDRRRARGHQVASRAPAADHERHDRRSAPLRHPWGPAWSRAAFPRWWCPALPGSVPPETPAALQAARAGRLPTPPWVERQPATTTWTRNWAATRAAA